MQNAISSLTSMIPMELDLMTMLKFIVILAAAALIISLIGRFVFGRRSALTRSISAAMGILCVYVLTVVVYTFNPSGLSRVLTPLPFVHFSGEYLHLFSFAEAGLTEICSQILSMIILVLLYNLMDDFLPTGKKLIGWLLYRFLTVAMAMVLHYIVTWAFDSFLPGVLVTYAPMILLGGLVIALLMGVLSLLLGLVLTVVNPIFGLLYAFFFSNKFGRNLSRAMLTTALLCLLVALLQKIGYGVICISAAALGAYIPLAAVLLTLWYFIGHKL